MDWREVQKRIEMSIEGHESWINDLQEEITKLEAKACALTKALNESRLRRGFGPPFGRADIPVGRGRHEMREGILTSERCINYD
jgi:hypothetical protein